MLINNTDGGGHPFHLHGHNFWVVATSNEPDAEIVYKGKYVLRDVVTVPAVGWAKIRFVADNPGVWLFHCHIDWHGRAGLVTTFIEAPEFLTKSSFQNMDESMIKACSNPAPSSFSK